MSEQLLNWAGNQAFHPARLHTPTTSEEVQEIVCGVERVKALGTRHSFNDIADTDADLVDMTGLSAIHEVSSQGVKIGPGIRYGDLAHALWKEGLTLANFASLPHISVGGSVATGTHGSGVRNASLSAAVSKIEIVQADGTLKTLQRGDEAFDGAVVGVGALGIVTSLTLDVVPAFEVAQTVYEGLPWKELEGELDAVLSGAYSVSLFTHWNSDRVDQVWTKRTDGASTAEYFGAKAADGPRHPLPDMPTENCTPQQGVPGPAYERLPHFRMEFTPSGGEELQTEYLMPRHHAFAALQAIDGMRERIAPRLFVSEIRTIAGSDLWLDPAYGQDSVAIHFTWRPMGEAVRALLPEIEARLEPFGARPHWGKLFAIDAERMRGLYPKIAAFDALRAEMDPDGKFRNAYLDAKLGAAG